MTDKAIDIAVGGHICLDLIPQFAKTTDWAKEFAPGNLIEVGPAIRSTGGAVSNTGVALHRLGLRPALNGKVGDDEFGREIIQLLERQSSSLTDHTVVSKKDTTSYTIVINPPNVDRVFLHCPGANDSFVADDVDAEKLTSLGTKLFHFGYPPVMRQMHENNGAELSRLMRSFKQRETTTSLDMCHVDPNSQAGAVDWRCLLQNVLPDVDLFLPSLDELRFMIDRRHLGEIANQSERSEPGPKIDSETLDHLATAVLQMGVAVIVIKLGQDGLYVRTTADADRLKGMGRAAPQDTDDWSNRQLRIPSFQVDVVGTTGAGDAAIAGFLMGMIKGWTLDDCSTAAAAVGAASVEASDAISGISHWSEIKERIDAGWLRRPLGFPEDC